MSFSLRVDNSCKQLIREPSPMIIAVFLLECLFAKAAPTPYDKAMPIDPNEPDEINLRFSSNEITLGTMYHAKPASQTTVWKLFLYLLIEDTKS